MRAFVAGIAGFLGSHVARELLTNGWDVDGADDFSYGDIHRLPVRLGRFTELDLAREVPAFDDTDVVFNCAAHARTMEVQEQPARAWRSNVDLAMNLAREARNHHARLVHASSCIVYASRSEYREQKRMAEAKIAEIHPTNSVSLRFANLFGMGQSEAGEHPNVLAAMKRSARRGHVTVNGTGHQTRDFLHVKDAARAMVLAAKIATPLPYYDICSGVQISIETVAECFNVPIHYQTRRSRDVDFIHMDPDPAFEHLGFRAEIDSLTAIKEYANG